MFYLELFKRLDEKQIRYLLVGGLAMNLHGVPRMTMDVDLVLAMEAANLAAFVALADELRLSPVAPVTLDSLRDTALLTTWRREKGMVAFALRGAEPASPTVDVLIDPPIDVAAALARAERRLLQGIPVALVAIDDLIRLKADTGRLQDQADIEHLRRLQSKTP